jgi:hypothetical protein
MKKSLAVFLFLFFFSINANALEVYHDVAQAPDGRAINSPTITVFATGTTTTISLYSNSSGTASKANPFTGDSSGRYSFFAAAGRYDIQISKTGFTTRTKSYVLVGLFFDTASVSGEFATGDLITSGPWIDSRKYATLALADAAAVSANKPLRIVGDYTISTGTTLSSNFELPTGSSITTSATLTISGTAHLTGGTLTEDGGTIIFTNSVQGLLTVDSVASLRNITPHKGLSVQLLGYYTAGDGAFGHFVWDDSDVSGRVGYDTQSGIYVAPTSDLTGASGAWVRQYDGAISVLWFGVTGAADNIAINAAINYGGFYKIPVNIPWQDYDIADTIEINQAWNYIVMAPPQRQLSGSHGLIWSGGNNDVVVSIDKQSDASHIEGLSAVNGNSATGLTGFYFFDSGNGTATYARLLARDLSTKLMAIGLHLGDETNFKRANFNSCTWDGFRSYADDLPIFYDSGQSDGNTIQRVHISGGIYAANTSDYKIYIKTIGNTVRLEDGFIDLAGINADGYAIVIENGDGAIRDWNMESGGNVAGSLKVDVSGAGRTGWTIENMRSSTCKTQTGEYSIYINSWMGATLLSVSVEGNIHNPNGYPITAVNTIFYSGYGFTGTTKYSSLIGTRTRTGTGNTAVAKVAANANPQGIFDEIITTDLNVGGVLHFVSSPTATTYADETTDSVFSWATVTASYVSFEIHYMVMRTSADLTTGFAESGVASFVVFSDSGNNIIASTPVKTGASQVLDGTSSLVVTFTVSVDSTNKTVTLMIDQNNETGDNPAEGFFHVEVRSTTGTNFIDSDRTKFSWTY